MRSAYPDEKGYVDKRQKELQDIWDALKVCFSHTAISFFELMQSAMNFSKLC